MSNELVFRYITRSFVIFFLFWIFVDLLAVPREVVSLNHSIHLLRLADPRRTDLIENTYWVRYYAISLTETLIKVAVYLGIIPYFYRGAPALRRFLETENA